MQKIFAPVNSFDRIKIYRTLWYRFGFECHIRTRYKNLSKTETTTKSTRFFAIVSILLTELFFRNCDDIKSKESSTHSRGASVTNPAYDRTIASARSMNMLQCHDSRRSFVFTDIWLFPKYVRVRTQLDTQSAFSPRSFPEARENILATQQFLRFASSALSKSRSKLTQK